MNTQTDMRQAGLSREQPQYEALKKLGEALKRCDYRFTTATPATHARVNGRAGNEWARDLAGVFGWSRPFDPSQDIVVPEEIHALMREAGILAPAQDGQGGLRSRLRVSSLDGEIFFHSAYPTAESDAVFFGPDTYRFADAIRHFLATRSPKVRRAVDIGCGAGPGAVMLGKRFPDAEVLAVDINPSALQLSAVNAALAGTTKVMPCFSDLLKDVPGNFDLIVSNPPYLVDPAMRAYRHGGGALGAGLSLDIVKVSLNRLNPGGTLLLYTGAAIVDGIDPLHEAVAEILHGKAVQWTYREMDPDVFGEELECEAYAHADRIAAVVLGVTKHG